MLDLLVERLSKENIPKLTEKQRQSVIDGLKLYRGFGWENDSVDQTYCNIAEALVNSEGYAAFEKWLDGAKAAPGILSPGDSRYLEASEELLHATSISFLPTFGVFVRAFCPRSINKRGYEAFGVLSKIFIRTAKNHPDLLDRWFLTLQQPILFSGDALQSYLHADRELDPDLCVKWFDEGIRLLQEAPKQAQAYFSIYTSLGQASLRKHMPGIIGLEEVINVLQLYSRALAGRGFVLVPITDTTDVLQRPYTDGRCIWVPSMMDSYSSKEGNFQAYKVVITCQAAKAEFGTFALENKDIQSLVERLEAKYSTHAKAITPLQRFYSAFPEPQLAEALFQIIEGRRIINKIKENYRGIRQSLDMVIKREIELMPLSQFNDGNAALEAFAQYITSDAIPSLIHPSIRLALEELYKLAVPATKQDATVVDALYAVAACYEFFKVQFPQKAKQEQGSSSDQDDSNSYHIENMPYSLFPYQGEFELAPVEHISGSIAGDMNRIAGTIKKCEFTYPEWNVIHGDYLLDWCGVNEFKLHPAKNVPPLKNKPLHRQIAQIFEKMYFGLSEKMRHEPQGEDINIDTLIEFMVDRAAGISREPDFYIQRRKRPRGIAAAFLVDVSPSALFPLNEGSEKRVIDAERESLELLVSGMGQVGHIYGIFGFSGYKRDDVRVYVVKGFNEKFERSILYSLQPRSIDCAAYTICSLPPLIIDCAPEDRDNPITLGTYTGPAIRHVTSLLAAREEAVRILFLLTDSEPSSSDRIYEGEYARVDVRQSFLEAERKGVHPFAISFGNAKELSRMYGKNFIAIAQPEQLLHRLPRIYTATTR